MLYHSSKIAFRESTPDVRKEVDAFARRVWEFCDFLVNVLGVEKIPGKYEAKVALHNSCHGKGSGTPAALKKLAESIDGLKTLDFDGSENCCGFGGTFSVVFPQLSSEMGEKKVRSIAAADPDIVCAADTSCLMHQKGIADKLGVKYRPMHAAELFYAAHEKRRNFLMAIQTIDEFAKHLSPSVKKALNDASVGSTLGRQKVPGGGVPRGGARHAA